MPVEPIRQTSFNAGELDPRLHGRRDVKLYFSALAYAENLSISPAGAINQRPGTAFIDYCRHALDPVTFLAGAVTVGPKGGDGGDLVDHDTDVMVTADGIGAADVVLFEIDLGAGVDVACVDLIDFMVQPGAGPPATPPTPPITYPWPEVTLPFVRFDDPEISIP